MSEATLTLNFLRETHNRLQKGFPQHKPMAGIIMHPTVWAACQEEINKYAATSFVDGVFPSGFYYYMGAPIYECEDVAPENTEIWYDSELMQNRLKQLKLA